MSKIENLNSLETYQFNVSGEKGEYRTTFLMGPDKLESSCTCKHGNDRKPCWHANYVLAGKTSRITGGDTARQAELINRVSELPDGKQKLRHARRRFADESHCRRCNSDKVVKIKYSLIARLFTIFKESRHTYFCRNCKWTW